MPCWQEPTALFNSVAFALASQSLSLSEPGMKETF